MSVLKFPTGEGADPVIPVEVQRAVLAANGGDPAALPALKRALADHPDLIDRLGDLAAHAERQLVALVAGPSLAASEAVAAHLARTRRELGAEAADPLEKLLIARVALCWLAVHAAELDRGRALGGGAGAGTRAADERVDRAHARFLTATRTLAAVRRLLGPAVPQPARAAPSPPGARAAAG